MTNGIKFPVLCGRCGHVTVALAGRDGMMITEDPVTGAMSFSEPLRCVFCQVLIHVRLGHGTLEEDEQTIDIDRDKGGARNEKIQSRRQS